MLRTILSSFILFLTFQTILISQKITEGEMEIELVNFNSPEFDNSDTSFMFKLQMTMIKNQFYQKIAFNDQKIVLSNYENNRVVFDFASMQQFEFEKIGEETYYFIEPIPEVQMNLDSIPISDEDIAKESSLIESYKYDLDCWKYEEKIDGVNTTLVITRDVDMPGQLGLMNNPFNLGTIVHSKMEDDQGNLFEFAMTSFSREISDKSIFSIDTIGMQNGNALRSYMQELNEEADIERQEIIKKYGEYQNTETNFEILVEACNLGILDTTYFSIKSALDDKLSIDIPTIFSLNHFAAHGFQDWSSDKLINLIQKSKLESPSIIKLLNDDKNSWDSLSKDMKYHSIIVASLKDHFSKKETLQQVKENVALINMSDAYVKNTKYTEDDKNDYASILSNLNVLSSLYTGPVVGNESTLDYVKQFFTYGLSGSTLDPSYSMDGEVIIMDVGSQEYKIELSRLRENYSDDQGHLMYEDTTSVDAHFYYPLLQVLKQIGADHDLKMAYSLYDLSPPGTNDINQYDYQQVVETYEYLSIHINGLYLNRFEKEAYHPGFSFGTSFPYHPNGNQEQIEFPNIMIGDIDAGVEYLSTQIKDKFVNFVKSNTLDLTMQTDRLQSLESEMVSQLYKDPLELITLLENVSLSVGRFNMSSIDLTKATPIETVYPSVSRFFGDSCKEYLIRKVEGTNERLLIISEQELPYENMQEMLGIIVDKVMSGNKEVIKSQRSGSFSTQYFIMSKDQINALENLFGVSLF